MDVFSFVIAHNTTLAAVIILSLGIWVYYDRRRDHRNVAFGTLLVVVAMWILTLVLWRDADEPESKVFWLRSLFFIGSLIPLLFFIFVSAVATTRSPALWVQGLTALPNAFLFWAAYYSNLVVNSVGDAHFVVSSGRNLFAAHFAMLLSVSLAIIYYASRRMDPKDRIKLIYILIGATIAFDAVFAVLYGTSFTSVPNTIFIANIGLVIGMSVMASSILEKDFITRVRLLGPQLFTVFALFVVIFNIVITETQIDFALRLVMISILILYTALITRTFIEEVHRMQHVQVLSDQTLKLNKALIDADRLKSRFVSLASHQLRSPVSGIRAYLQMLRNEDFGKVNDEQKRILSTNVDALGQLGETIDTFLDATKIQLGKLELFKGEVLIDKSIRQAIAELEPLAKKKGLTINYAIQPDLPPTICDEGKIFHVLINLLDNAIKYSKNGEVAVSARQEGNKIVIRVKDQGLGLTAEEKSHIFEVFSRGMEAVRLDAGGSGLGLYIVKNILDAHGVTFTFDSEGRNKGSTFVFSLPVV